MLQAKRALQQAQHSWSRCSMPLHMFLSSLGLLAETLSNPAANLTVFAPTNEGFTKSLGLLGIPGINAQTLQQQGLLAPILKNHVVMGAQSVSALLLHPVMKLLGYMTFNVPADG